MNTDIAAFSIRAEIADLDAGVFEFAEQKSMYGGKTIGVGDTIFLFASENEGGHGLFARSIVSRSASVPRRSGVERQTPRIFIEVGQIGIAKSTLGRAELRAFSEWSDGGPETEFNFKLYRQATNKIVVLTNVATSFLNGLARP